MPHKYWYCGTFDFKKVSKTGYAIATGISQLSYARSGGQLLFTP